MHMYTITETVLDGMMEPIIGAGSTINDTMICTLYDVLGIDRLHIDGRWFRVMFPQDKYGRRQLSLHRDFSEETASYYE